VGREGGRRLGEKIEEDEWFGGVGESFELSRSTFKLCNNT